MSAGRFQRRIGDYLMPDPLASLDDLDRLLHRDLPHMTDDELCAEEWNVRRALAIAQGKRLLVTLPGVCQWVSAAQWLDERLHAILAEERWCKGFER
jgi:hypothetical protein